jgi:hypothetical protein
MGIETTSREKKGKLIGRHIQWQQVSWWKRHYIMYVDGDPTATLRFSNWSNAATVDGLGERWTFERKGFWRQEILTRDEDLGESAKPFRYNWSGGGKLTLDETHILTLRHNAWGSKTYWETDSKEVVMTFRRVGFWKSSTVVEFGDTAGTYPELPTLIFLGFFLRILHEYDAAAAGAG